MAVLALPAVGGKFGVRGGGYSMSNSASWDIERPWIGGDEPRTRVVNMNHLGRALTEYDDPPVDVLFVYNCNPAATVPDQRRVIRGLERDDLFTVVFEQVMTDTALYADVVLPATTFLEGYDFAKAYGPINMELGGSGRGCRRRGALERRRVRRAMRAAGSAERWRADRRARSDASRVSMRCPATIGADLGAGKRPYRRSATRRSNSWTSFRTRPTERSTCSRPRSKPARRWGCIGSSRIPATERYPLALISPASDRTISSTLGELPRPDVKLSMHPGRCRRRGDWRTATWSGCSTSSARFTAPLNVTASIRPGTVSLPKGLWRRSTRNGAHRDRARAGHADRSRRRRLLQRRARAGRVARHG